MLNSRFHLASVVFVFVFILGSNRGIVYGQDESTEPKIDFTKTIKPIIETRCSTCHNEADEEGGLNLDDPERLAEYVTSGEPLESGLFQSLTGANGLSLMPPEEDNDGNPLESCSNAEMALIYLWIQQGASFAGVEVPEKDTEEAKSAAQRIFLFSGYLHPAIVHFPIALITMSAFFIVVFFRYESLADDAAYYLLFFGTLSAIVGCVVGWAYADRNPVSITDWSISINRHRWMGIAATLLALVCVVLGWRSRNDIAANGKGSGLWKFGVILTAALMGVVGHQGGEEVHGEGMYERAAEKLIPEFWPFGAKNEEKQVPDPANENADSSTDQKSVDQNDTGEKQSNEKSESDESSSDNESDLGNQKTSGTENSSATSDQKSDGPGNNDERNEGQSPPSDPTIKKK